MENFFELIESEEVYRAILDLMPIGVLLADRNYIVRYVNRRYTEITKYSKEMILKKSLLELPGAQLPYTIDSGKEQLKVTRKNNYNMVYNATMTAIRENGEIIGGLSVVEDITELTRISEEEREAKNKLRVLEKKVKNLGNGIRYTFDDIVSADIVEEGTKKKALKLAESDANILLFGESGTGKELYAQSIHAASNRSDKRFVAINCATLDEHLLESELFGYSEGSFTGAQKKGKKGIFEEADGGTFFLDEVSELDYKLQAKLLRVLQEQKVRPIGSSFEKKVNVRIIAATNKNLEHMVEKGLFRQDLYYRLSVVTLNLPPLRECKSNVRPLLLRYLDIQSEKDNKTYCFEEGLIEALEKYNWPGNVRELVNVVYVGAIMSENGIITQNQLPERIRSFLHRDSINFKENLNIAPLSERVKQFEIEEIRKTVELYGDTLEGKKNAARQLNISLATLYNKIK